MDNQELIKLDITLAFKEIKKSSGIHAKAIGWYTKSNFYHVEMTVGGKWISSNSDEGGVTFKDLLPLNNKWTYFKLEPVYLSSVTWENIKDYITSQQGKKYDWLGIMFAQILPFTLHSENKWYCSEICCKLLQLLGVKETYNLLPHEVSPGELAQALNINKPYKPIEG